MVNKYYQKHKKRLRKEAGKRYQNLSEEEKDKAKKGPRKIKILLNFVTIKRSFELFFIAPGSSTSHYLPWKNVG